MDVLKIMWKFSQEIQWVDVLSEIHCGKNTLNKLFSKLRRLCRKYYEDNYFLLGGDGYIINCDESVFRHKPKYHRGRPTTQEFWVFGIVYASVVPSRGYMTLVKNRSVNTLLPIIKKHVKEGSVVYTDCWAAYDNINSIGLHHETVNHSLHFVNPKTGLHTQFIESYWAKQKYRQKKIKGSMGIWLKTIRQLSFGRITYVRKIFRNWLI